MGLLGKSLNYIKQLRLRDYLWLKAGNSYTKYDKRCSHLEAGHLAQRIGSTLGW